MLRALIFDVDGTLADTESTHRQAFNAAFVDAGLDWYWSEPLYAQLLEVAGGMERMQHYWRSVDPQAACSGSAQRTLTHLHAAKTKIYEAMTRDGQVPLRPGVLALIQEATQRGIPLSIATTTTPANIHALLQYPLGADWRRFFLAVADGHSAPLKKPDPQAYLQVLAALDLPATACLAFEDSYNGLRAARAAGIQTVVTPTAYTANHDFGEALQVLPSLAHAGGDGEPPRRVSLEVLRRWHGTSMLTA